MSVTKETDAGGQYAGVNGAYFKQEFLDDAWRELHSKALFWRSGMDIPSPTDQLAYAVLKLITRREPKLASGILETMETACAPPGHGGAQPVRS